MHYYVSVFIKSTHAVYSIILP